MSRTTALAALVACLAALPGTPSAGDTPCATRDADFDRMFTRADVGWHAGDAAYSVALPGDRSLWLFGDSFLGTDGAPHIFVRNAVVLQVGDSLSTLGPARSFLEPPGGESHARWLWPADGTVENGRLRVIYEEIERTGGGGWNFKPIRPYVATFELGDMSLVALRAREPDTVMWGSTIFETARFDYVYGVDMHASPSVAYLARASRGNLDGAWRYWDGRRWSRRREDAVPVIEGVSSEFGVVRQGAELVAITQPSLGRDIVALHGLAPQGPWSRPRVIYRTPESSSYLTYNAFPHPEFDAATGLLISYNVMRRAGGDPSPDDYRPRFIRATSTCLG